MGVAKAGKGGGLGAALNAVQAGMQQAAAYTGAAAVGVNQANQAYAAAANAMANAGSVTHVATQRTNNWGAAVLRVSTGLVGLTKALLLVAEPASALLNASRLAVRGTQLIGDSEEELWQNRLTASRLAASLAAKAGTDAADTLRPVVDLMATLTRSRRYLGVSALAHDIDSLAETSATASLLTGASLEAIGKMQESLVTSLNFGVDDIREATNLLVPAAREYGMKGEEVISVLSDQLENAFWLDARDRSKHLRRQLEVVAMERATAVSFGKYVSSLSGDKGVKQYSNAATLAAVVGKPVAEVYRLTRAAQTGSVEDRRNLLSMQQQFLQAIMPETRNALAAFREMSAGRSISGGQALMVSAVEEVAQKYLGMSLEQLVAQQEAISRLDSRLANGLPSMDDAAFGTDGAMSQAIRTREEIGRSIEAHVARISIKADAIALGIDKLINLRGAISPVSGMFSGVFGTAIGVVIGKWGSRFLSYVGARGFSGVLGTITRTFAPVGSVLSRIMRPISGLAGLLTKLPAGLGKAVPLLGLLLSAGQTIWGLFQEGPKYLRDYAESLGAYSAEDGVVGSVFKAVKAGVSGLLHPVQAISSLGVSISDYFSARRKEWEAKNFDQQMEERLRKGQAAGAAFQEQLHGQGLFALAGARNLGLDINQLVDKGIAVKETDLQVVVDKLQKDLEGRGIKMAEEAQRNAAYFIMQRQYDEAANLLRGAKDVQGGSSTAIALANSIKAGTDSLFSNLGKAASGIVEQRRPVRTPAPAASAPVQTSAAVDVEPMVKEQQRHTKVLEKLASVLGQDTALTGASGMLGGTSWAGVGAPAY